jgi:tetratricopeptide (TPR) repeat protein
MSEPFKRLVAVLIASVAAMLSVVSLWQSNASEMDAQASRDFQRYGLEVMGKSLSGQAVLAFDSNRAFAAWQFFSQLAFNAEQAGDQKAAERYRALSAQMRDSTPLLQPPYFDPQEQEADLLHYAADRLLVELARLNEQFSAALSVREAWNGKLNAYAIHQTLLSVSLFLLGLAATLNSRLMQRAFAVIGVLIALLASAAAFSTWQTPVRDLRRVPSAIEAYAQGMGWIYRQEFEKAFEAFSRAIAAAPDYAQAYLGRTLAANALDNLEQVIADFEQARQLGDRSVQTLISLAWTYARTYQYDSALRLYEEALSLSPEEIWAYFDLGLVRLVSGAPFEQVQAAYEQGMRLATRLTAESRAGIGAPPSYLWEALDDASLQLDRVVRTLRQDTFFDGVFFPLEKLRLAPEQAAQIEALAHALKSLAVSLEYYGAPPTARSAARFSPLRILDSDGAAREIFPDHTGVLWLKTTFSGARDGSDLLIKFFHDGFEDMSLRFFESWSYGAQGDAEIEIAASEGGNFAFERGDYIVELYIDGQFMTSGRFRIE